MMSDADDMSNAMIHHGLKLIQKLLRVTKNYVNALNHYTVPVIL